MALFFVLLQGIACATLTPIAYAPHPERIEDPAAEVVRLVASTPGECISEATVSPVTVVVRRMCDGGHAETRVVKPGHMASLRLESVSAGWHRLFIEHDDGTPPFFWHAGSVDDLTRLADALAALTPGAETTATGRSTLFGTSEKE